MHKLATYLTSLVVFSLPLLLLQTSVTNGSITRIGVILDQKSRPGKEAKVAIDIAIQDFNNEANQLSVLYPQNTRKKHVHAAIAAKELLDNPNMKAILGGHTWEEASAIAEIINESDRDIDIPVFLSLAGTTPLHEPDQWPFFVQSVPTHSIQMNAIAAIIQSFGIRQVTLIYETSYLASSSVSIISHLCRAFRQTGCELTSILPLNSRSSSLHKKLEVLKLQQRKVFVIHTSLDLAIPLFQAAKKSKMTGDGYLWITTNLITDLFHSVPSTMISSLKGMVGVKTYFPEKTPEFQPFKEKFRQKFRSDYSEEEYDEPGIFAVQGYNAVKMLLEENSPKNINRRSSIPAITVEIVYVIGKRYHSVYWTEKLGFSETIDNEINGEITYTNSIDNLQQILFPVQPWHTHLRHRILAGNSEIRMRVGVPAQSLFKQFVNVEFDTEKNQTDIGIYKRAATKPATPSRRA